VSAGRSSGSSLLEAVVILTLVTLVTGVGVPPLLRAHRSMVLGTAAHHLVSAVRSSRWMSITSGTGHGLHFQRRATGWVWFVVRDGNANGVRIAEVRDGVDPTLSGPHRLAAPAVGIDFGFASGGPFPRVPPASGLLSADEDPIRIGSRDLLAFGPDGGANSGTIYLSDGEREMMAVVIYGVTARLRVRRWRAAAGAWVG